MTMRMPILKFIILFVMNKMLRMDRIFIGEIKNNLVKIINYFLSCLTFCRRLGSVR